MLREQFNENWVVSFGAGNSLMEMFKGNSAKGTEVTLPHDAMIYEERNVETANGGQTGFYPGGIYNYVKKFMVPKEWRGKTVTLEFEGAYMNARVYINEEYAGGYPNGYSNFYIVADDFLKYGEENAIRVVVNNSTELNSRWYSGSGLYRNVKIIVGNSIHIPIDGLRISTPEIDNTSAVVMIHTPIKNKQNEWNKIKLFTQIRDQEGNVVNEEITTATVFADSEIQMHQRVLVREPKLWDCNNPYLYECVVKVLKVGDASGEKTAGEEVLDEEIQHFGIRKLQLDSINGLRINGNMVKLRGTCIHHDNGLIGAATLERAEERRCELLKAAGFNCIRSAHHPMSKAMLDACDRRGMLVMDELSDMWTRPKNQNDYGQYFSEFWEEDVERLIAKDYNHPSVILYCMGNEIQEIGTAKGAELNRKIDTKIKSLDSTRYTTNALNGMIAAGNRVGEILCDITGKKPEELSASMMVPAETTEEKNKGGSDELNDMMGMMMGGIADAMAAHPLMSEQIEEAAQSMDIAGYNYMTGRHEIDHALYPNRVVLGAETYPADIVKLWDIVKKNNHVIGDMTWTGFDYLGEAGIGIFYYDGTTNFSSHWPDRLAYVGDLDIIGYRRPISYLREIVFGLRKEPYLAVERLNHYGEKPNKTPWMWKDNIASWTWHGYEGKPACINVCAAGDEVELFLNEVSLGRKPAGESAGYVAEYEITYEPGELKAVNYKDGEAIGSCILKTVSENVEFTVDVDRSMIKADGADLSYVTVGFVDEMGNQNLQIVKDVTVTVEGVGTLQGYGSAAPQVEGSYQDTTWAAYDGYVMAVIRAGKETGEIKVSFSAEGCETVSKIIEVCAPN